MKQFCTISTACVCISTILLSSSAFSDTRIIDSMNITGGMILWGEPPQEIIFSNFGENTNLVGGYIGVGGSTSEPSDPPDPDNIIIFSASVGDVVTYTAESNLGTTSNLAGSIPGGPVPTGSLDDDLYTIQMDLSSWFATLNNSQDIWVGTGQDDGFTSLIATGTWDPVTFEYELSWNSMIPPDSPFAGIKSSWTFTGYAYPASTLSIVVDIRPFSSNNNVNPNSSGLIAVAVLTTESFDALQVDPETVQFGPAGATRVHAQDHVKDVDKDGDIDVLFHFRIPETGIQCGDTEAALIGHTYDGASISGADLVNTFGCR